MSNAQTTHDRKSRPLESPTPPPTHETPADSPRPPEEKPQNGIAGLKHFRYDLRSGFMVAMISLPFSMGIAITSGAPPICGIMSAIIAGFLLPFLGGSYVTISGPAAGLAPALFSGMIMLATAYLGHGAPQAELLAVGYPLVLVAICFAGVIQIVLARLKVARLSSIFPSAAIEGMLAAIGLLIIVKQFPLLLGQKFESHEFWAILAETPGRLAAMNPQVFGLGLACTALLFVLAAIPSKLLKVMPPPVWIFFAGTLVSYFFLNLGSANLINIPERWLENGLVIPHFDRIFSTPATWLPLAYVVVVLILIDGTESLATIMAVDKLDVYKRRSDPDRTLSAMGACNVASSALGGLTIIPGIVKSTANIIGGGRTQWANFCNACFLLLFLVFARDLITKVPLAVLASILVFIGWKLCGPKVWKHVASIGTEQFAIFAVTILVTVTTDLLIGVATGVAMKLVLNLWYVGLAYRLNGTGAKTPPRLLTRMAGLFRNPVGRRHFSDGVYELYINRPLVCFNLFHVIRELQEIPQDAKSVRVHLSPEVAVVDHTTAETLFHYVQEFNSRDLHMELVNWDKMRPLSDHPSATQLGLSGELIESVPPHVAHTTSV